MFEKQAVPECVGIDLGFGQIQATRGMTDAKGTELFLNEPSIVGTPSIMNSAYDSAEGITIVEDKQVYYVGRKALEETTNSNYSFAADKIESDFHDLIKYKACLAWLASYKPKTSFRVCTGLPFYEYATLKDTLREKLLGEFNIEYNNHQFKIDVPQVDIIIQGIGSYYDEIYDENGEVNPDKIGILNGRTLIIEVGFRTIEIITMEAGRFKGHPLSMTVEHGISRVHNHLRMMLKREGFSFRAPQIDAAVRTQQLVMEGGKTKSLSSDIQTAAEQVWHHTLQEIQFSIPNYKRYYDHVIVSGGGALNLFEFVQNEFGNITKLQHRGSMEAQKAPDEANAGGYRKRALFLQKNGK